MAVPGTGVHTYLLRRARRSNSPIYYSPHTYTHIYLCDTYLWKLRTQRAKWAGKHTETTIGEPEERNREPPRRRAGRDGERIGITRVTSPRGPLLAP